MPLKWSFSPIQNLKILFKSRALSLLYPCGALTSCKVPEKTIEQSLRYLKTDGPRTNERTTDQRTDQRFGGTHLFSNFLNCNLALVGMYMIFKLSDTIYARHLFRNKSQFSGKFKPVGMAFKPVVLHPPAMKFQLLVKQL